jgi:hypothetical protein
MGEEKKEEGRDEEREGWRKWEKREGKKERERKLMLLNNIFLFK